MLFALVNTSLTSACISKTSLTAFYMDPNIPLTIGIIAWPEPTFVGVAEPFRKILVFDYHINA